MPDPLPMRTDVAAGEPPPAAFTFGDVLEIVKRHHLAAGAALLLVALATVGLALLKTPLYEAQASIALDRGRRAVDFDPRAQFDVYRGNYEHALLNTQRNILLSRSVLRAALKTGGLQANEPYASAADPVETLRQRFNVTPSRDSWDLSLYLRDEDPRRAELALQAVLDAFTAREVGMEKERSDTSISFLEQQLAEAGRKLERARNEQHAYQSAKGLLVLDIEKSLPAQRLTTLNSKRAVLAQQIVALEGLVGQIMAHDAIADPRTRLDAMLGLEMVNRHPMVAEQQKLLLELKTHESQLNEKYLERHPRMVELRSQIIAKNDQLEQMVQMVRAGIFADHAKLTAQIPLLDASAKAIEEELTQYRENLFNLHSLAGKAEAAERLYEQMLKRLGEERVSQRLEVQQMTVLDQPKAGSAPVNLRLGTSLTLAVVLGLFAAVAAPLLLDFFGRRTYGSRYIRDLLGVPVVGELPYIWDLQPLGMNGDADANLRLAEAYRGLRTSLRLARRDQERGAVLVITSCGEHEGKSTVSARLAVSMASSGQRVLLVDGDLRQPTQREQLGQACKRGFSELLAGEPGMAPATSSYPNLDFLDAGAKTPNPGELLNSHCLPEWLEQCRATYDFVIIDTPPLRWFADALVITEHADHLLLVVRDGATYKSSLAKARVQLGMVASKLMGAVLITQPETLSALGFYGRDPYGERRASQDALGGPGHDSGERSA